MQPEVKLTPFEAGQLYALLGPSGLQKLSPELRRKLRESADAQQAPEAQG